MLQYVHRNCRPALDEVRYVCQSEREVYRMRDLFGHGGEVWLLIRFCVSFNIIIYFDAEV